jgi:predicted transcriptional regulator
MCVYIKSKLDRLLKILENPVRRKIIESLSREPNYPLQLSKDLGLGQQSITQHLERMEKSGLVDSDYFSSPSGPKRKVFKLAKSFSIVLDVAPHLFKQNIVFFDVEPQEYSPSGSLTSLVERRDMILDYPTGKDKIEPISEAIADIDEKLENMEKERMLLLSIRNTIMREASKIIQEIDNPEARRVFHQVLDEEDTSVRHISEVLNLREENVRKLLQKLKNEFSAKYF